MTAALYPSPISGWRGAAVASFTTATSKPCSSSSRRWLSTHRFASIPARMTLSMRRLQDEVIGLRSPHFVGADHDGLAVLDEGLVALEPVGPGAREPV